MTFDFETIVQRNSSSLIDKDLAPGFSAAGGASFNGAEPLYPVAPAIRGALIRMAENGRIGFTLMDEPYRRAVVGWMRDARGFAADPDWIVPTLGTIFSLATAIRLLVAESESIIVTPPVYNRYEQAASRLRRKTVKCPLLARDGRYAMDFGAIGRAMARPDAKLFVLCNPHNPIGQIWGRGELERLAALAFRHGVTVFSDEIFAENSLGGLATPSYLTVPGAAGRCIVATSLGKAFGTTGFNHANMLIPDAGLREAFADRRDRDHFGSMDPVAYECLLAAYSPEGLAWLQASNDVMLRNMDAVRAFLAEHLPDVRAYGGEGGYILWLDWRARFAREADLMDFLAHRASMHLDAGSHYGGEGFARMSLACPERCVAVALASLKEALR
ncbi:MAG: aminotransferase class I/II-fold pyridoxal phosphate-dependent enzyme [Clostridiales bacterium]|jgi:cystathionine beta-lyase|nr:aminotransferase class I/II-fold pyridoxal phosphate-dependent enzyme [Clostridiales bacterium]